MVYGKVGRSIFIQENFADEAPEFCDKVVSALSVRSKECLYQDVDLGMLQQTYDYIFSEFTERFKEDGRFAKASYRGVSIPACFKLDMFYYAASAAVLSEALRRIVKENQECDTYAYEGGYDWKNPYVHQILKGCLPEIQQGVKTIKAKQTFSFKKQVLSRIRGINTLLKNCFWPAEISIHYGDRPVAFFSDYQRVKGLIPLLRKSAVFFTDSKSPRIYMNSIREKILYYQTGGLRSYPKRYYRDAHDITKQIRDADIFNGMKTDSCNLGYILNNNIEKLCLAQLPSLLYQIDKMHDFFKKNPSIKTLLLDEDITPVKNAFCKIARSYNAISYVECHGALSAAPGYVPVTADFIFAWGAEQKNTLVRWGCADKKVVVSGCSYYDQYQKMDETDVRKNIFSMFDFNIGAKTVIFAPHPLHNERHFTQKIIRDRVDPLLDLILKRSDIQLFIKLHPGDVNYQYYHDRCLKPDVKCRVRVLKKFNPYLLIKSSDFVIAHDSTIAVDGFALERNVIFFPLFEYGSGIIKDSVSEFKKYNVFYCPKTLDDFEKTFEQLLKDSSLKPSSAKWKDARAECLNEGKISPQEIILSHLLRGAGFSENQ